MPDPVTRRRFMGRAGSLALAGYLLAACGSDDTPTFESEDGAPITAAPTSTSTSTTATTAPVALQELTLTLTGEGTAEATLTYDGDQLCLRGTTDGVGAVTSGRIHAGRAGEAGPPVVDLGIETAGDGPSIGPGRDVTVAWRPEHTFVVSKESAHA